MRHKPYLCVEVFLLGAVSFCLVGCSTSADSRHAANQRPQASQEQQQIQTVSRPDPNTVRFVAEATQPPELYSRGSYIDEQHAWVAAGFQVKRTTDGGRTWQLMRPSAESEPVVGKLGDIYHLPSFITPTRGWLNVMKGTWQTKDGGSTWRQAFSEDTDAPRFSDEQHGWIATYEGKYQQSHVTKDGGLTWQPCGSKRGLNQQTPNIAFFLTSKLGWAITSYTDDERQTLYGVAKTADGGCSWQQLWTSRGDPDQMFCEIYFLNEKVGWLGGCFTAGGLFRTRDGGKTWQEMQRPTSNATAIHVYFSNEDEGWIITRASKAGVEDGMYHTTDGGRSWIHMSNDEILTGVGGDGAPNQIPANWKAGRLFQMLLFGASVSNSGRQ